MADDAQKNRTWERYCSLLPCQLIPAKEAEPVVAGRIINIGRGGILVEADFDFKSGDRVTVVIEDTEGDERFEMRKEIRGTVRWGQIDPRSLMGLFYIGVEFDELLPLKQAASRLI